MIIHLIILLKNSNNEIKTLTQTAGPAGATLLATAAPLCTIGGPISVGAGLNLCCAGIGFNALSASRKTLQEFVQQKKPSFFIDIILDAKYKNKMTNGAILDTIQQTVKVMSQLLSQNYHHYSPANITNRSIHREYNKKKIIS